jgi:hypothetical protein
MSIKTRLNKLEKIHGELILTVTLWIKPKGILSNFGMMLTGSQGKMGL